MNRVSLCFAFYRNGGVLARQYAEWAAWPKEIKANVEVVVCDDGSPENRAIDIKRPKGLPALKILAMRQDIRWNQDACRNLAVAQSSHPWLLLTDMDHIPTERLMVRVVAGKLKAGNVYKFARVSAPNLQPYKVHPNSWLMTRERYEDVGGYDERYAGFYGTDAAMRDGIMASLAKTGGSLEMIAEPLIRVPREVIPDASTVHYGRKEPQDGENIRRIKAEIAALPEAERRPVRGRFEWDRLL